MKNEILGFYECKLLQLRIANQMKIQSARAFIVKIYTTKQGSVWIISLRSEKLMSKEN